MDNNTFILVNDKVANLSPEQVFDAKKYTDLIAVTYSASANFVNKYFSNFKNVDLVLGIPESNTETTAAQIQADQVINTVGQLKNNMLKNFYALSTTMKDKLTKHHFNIYISTKKAIHDKFYLLKNASGQTRVIIGSANASNQAFNANIAQSECVFIFDDDEKLYNAIYQHYSNDIATIVQSYYPNMLLKKYKETKNKQAKDKKDVATVFTLDSNEEADINTDAISGAMDSVEDKEDVDKDTNSSKVLDSISDKASKLRQSNSKKNKQDLETVTILKQNILQRPNLPTKLRGKNTIKKRVKKLIVHDVVDAGNSKTTNKTIALRESLPVLLDRPLERNLQKGNSGILLKDKNSNIMHPIGKYANNDTIRKQLTQIDHLMETYRDYTMPLNDSSRVKNEYAKRPYEALIFAFTAPFLTEIRSKVKGNLRERVSNFLFLGADFNTGKSTLLDALRMMTAYSSDQISPKISWTNRFPGSSRKIFDASNELQILMTTSSNGTLFYDEIDPKFFEKNARDIILSSVQNSDSNSDIAPVIATTNSAKTTFEGETHKRLKFLNFTRKFPSLDNNDEKKWYNPTSVKKLHEILNNIDNSLFLDFIMRMSEKLNEDNIDWGMNEGENDFLKVSREIFRQYYKLADLPLPEYFPEEAIHGDYSQNSKWMWYKLYHSDIEHFVEKDGVLTYNLARNIASTSNFNKGSAIEAYRNALPTSVCYEGNKGRAGNIIMLNKKEFLKWINIKQNETFADKIKNFFS